MLSNNQMVEQRADMMQSNVYQNYQYPHNQTQVMSTKKQVNFKVMKWLGIIQIVFGIFMVILGFSLFLYGNREEFYSYGGYGLVGIIGGAWVIVSGILGLLLSRKPTSGCYNGVTLGFSTASLFIQTFNILLCALCIISLEETCFVTYYKGLPNEFYCGKRRTAKAFAWLLLIFNVVELFITIVVTIFSCLYYGNCCSCCTSSNTQDMLYQQNQQQTFLSNQNPFANAPIFIPNRQQDMSTSIINPTAAVQPNGNQAESFIINPQRILSASGNQTQIFPSVETQNGLLVPSSNQPIFVPTSSRNQMNILPNQQVRSQANTANL